MMTESKKPDKRRRDPFDEVLTTEEAGPSAEQALEAASHVETQVEQVIEGIERLPPSAMIPDRFQTRTMLPLEIGDRFFGGEIDCYKAAEAWLVLAEEDESVRRQVDRLLGMGESFDEHGQIKPITGSFVPAANGTYTFLIETGERRFWAACLQAVREGRGGTEPQLRVEVVERPTRYRQVLENRHAEPPSAVAQAREIAAIILAEAGKEPKSGMEDPYDYFRQALEMRKSQKLWSKLERLMQISRPRMVQIIGLLKLPTQILERANRIEMPDRVLRAILAQPQDRWEGLFVQAIKEGLTSEEVAEASADTAGATTKKTESERGRMVPAQSALRGIRIFSGAISKVDKMTQGGILDDLADEMMVRGDAYQVLPFLEELAKLLRVRIERMD
jgi:hypothetical protein